MRKSFFCFKLKNQTKIVTDPRQNCYPNKICTFPMQTKPQTLITKNKTTIFEKVHRLKMAFGGIAGCLSQKPIL